ncbi:MAG: prolyl oligopeptidase family serine peptidase [Oscillibacter sp.]|nr:prolyl oligopeptidase family serine peptidase [Oscillibacter sp.]
MKRWKRWTALALSLLLAASLTACGGGTAAPDADAEPAGEAETEEESMNASTNAMVEAETALENQGGETMEVPEGTPAAGGRIYVQGCEWGPGVPKLILELPVEVSEVYAEAKAMTAGTLRTVTGAWLSDDAGNPAEAPARFVTLELETNQAASGSPFSYNVEIFMNQWSASYPVIAAVTADGETYVLDADLIDSRVCPETEAFNVRGEFSGEYTNPMTGETEALTLRYAATAPEALVNDGAKNPLIVWLHGQGEGGTDVDIELIGNEVVALNREEIQGYFTTEGGAGGAYVLAVQCETYWMDGGDGTNSGGDLVSRYTEILMDTINAYLERNPDVDRDRIYLGGCSNGGYMTMNMLVSYPDVWAAAYPNCEAYAWSVYARDEDGAYAYDDNGGYVETDQRWMTEEKIQAIKDIPIWFIHASTDPVVVPGLFSMPTYRALLQAGAENTWFSLFETVEGTDDPRVTYLGHFAWVYTFNNQVTAVQDRDAIAASTDDEAMGFVPDNNGGGAAQAVDAEGNAYDNLFAWMNAQRKA